MPTTQLLKIYTCLLETYCIDEPTVDKNTAIKRLSKIKTCKTEKNGFVKLDVDCYALQRDVDNCLYNKQ